MHELLLFGQVPFTRHEQVLMILAGVAAMQPQPVTERHLVFKPARSPGLNGVKVTAKPGTSTAQVQALQSQMQGDLFYMQLVSNVNSKKSDPMDDHFIKVEDMDVGGTHVNGQANRALNSHNSMVSTKPATELSKYSWSFEFRDLPEVPGRRPVTSRLMASIPIASGDVLEFLDALGYVFISEYVLRGHQFVHENIVLLLHQPLLVPSSLQSEPSHGQPGTRRPLDELPGPERLKPLDSSNGFVLQASIRVQDGMKPELMNKATNELKAFKELMRGIVDIEIGDRLALDTRVK